METLIIYCFTDFYILYKCGTFLIKTFFTKNTRTILCADAGLSIVPCRIIVED